MPDVCQGAFMRQKFMVDHLCNNGLPAVNGKIILNGVEREASCGCTETN